MRRARPLRRGPDGLRRWPTAASSPSSCSTGAASCRWSRTDIDQAHRMFEVLNARGKPLARNDILKAELLGSVPASRAPAVKAIWDEAETRADSDFEQLFSHIRAMYRRPDGKVISDIRAIAAETGGAQPFIERVLQPSAAILDDIRNARHAGPPQSAADRPGICAISAGIRSPTGCRRQCCGGSREGRDAEGLARFLRQARPSRLRRAHPGDRRLQARAPVRRGGRSDRNGRDLDRADSPLELTRQELRTIQHNLRDLHERNAPAAKHLLHAPHRAEDGQARRQPDAPERGDRRARAAAKARRQQPVARLASRPRRAGAMRRESLGNLVLVTKVQNDRAGNQDLARKLEVYFNTPGAPIPAINEDLRGRSQWTRGRHQGARGGADPPHRGAVELRSGEAERAAPRDAAAQGQTRQAVEGAGLLTAGWFLRP